MFLHSCRWLTGTMIITGPFTIYIILQPPSRIKALGHWCGQCAMAQWKCVTQGGSKVFPSRYPYESFVPVLTVTYAVYRRWLLYPNYMETFDNLNVINAFFSRYPLFWDFSWVCHGVSKMRNRTIHPVFAFEVFRGRMWKFGCKVLWEFTCELKTASIGACGIFLYVFSDFPLSGGMKTSSV